MKTVELNGCSYAVEYHGHNDLPLLLMLHGFMGSRHVFDHLLAGLTKFCKPVTLDLLGHGDTQKVYEPERYHEDRQTADILQLVRELDSADVYLYGYSMGGRLALKTALGSPELFRGLILESSTYGIEGERQRAERISADHERAYRLRQDHESFLSDWKRLDLFESPVDTDAGLLSKYQRIQEEQDPRSMAASLRGFGTGIMRPAKERLPSFPRPVLLLAGSGDEKYVEINDTMVRLFSNAAFKKIEAGHRVHLDNPDELLNAINQFIAQN